MKAKAREIADSPLEWLDGTGEYSDIILSSRVRLARNLKGHAFPWRAGKEAVSYTHLDVYKRQALISKTSAISLKDTSAT